MPESFFTELLKAFEAAFAEKKSGICVRCNVDITGTKEAMRVSETLTKLAEARSSSFKAKSRLLVGRCGGGDRRSNSN